MARIDESSNQSQTNEVLRTGYDVLDGDAKITFHKYTRYVLPLDGYVYWLKDLVAAPLIVEGSLHYSTDQEQREDETIGINRVILTTAEQVQDFNAVASNTIWIGQIDSIRFAFTASGKFYKAAGIYHYRGDAIYPAMMSQIIDNPTDPISIPQVATNSLPIWIGLNSYVNPLPQYPATATGSCCMPSRTTAIKPYTMDGAFTHVPNASPDLTSQASSGTVTALLSSGSYADQAFSVYPSALNIGAWADLHDAHVTEFINTQILEWTNFTTIQTATMAALSAASGSSSTSGSTPYASSALAQAAIDALVGNATYSINGGAFGISFDPEHGVVWINEQTTNSIRKVDVHTGSGTEYGITNGLYYSCFVPTSAATFAGRIYSTSLSVNNVIGVLTATGVHSGDMATSTVGNEKICYEPGTPAIWIAAAPSNAVRRINLNTGIGATYSTGANPIGICYDSFTNSIWTANNTANTVSKINTVTGSKADYAAGNSPYGICFDSATNSIWVTNSTVNTVTKINALTGAFIGTYAVGTTPKECCFDNITNSVWVINYAGNTVSKLNSSTGSKIDVSGFSNAKDICFDYITASMWIVNQDVNTVRRLSVYVDSAQSTAAAGHILSGSGTTTGPVYSGNNVTLSRAFSGGYDVNRNTARAYTIRGASPLMVALPAGTSATAVSSSDNGVTWTNRTLPSSSQWKALEYNGSVLCAIGVNVCATSPDGITWTARTISAHNWNDIVWNGSIFCAVGQGLVFATSPDGITWTDRTAPRNNNWNCVAWGGGLFCASMSDNYFCATSTDGITWTSHTVPSGLGAPYSLAYGAGVFCLVMGGGAPIYTSPDGITWTSRTAPSGNWVDIIWNGSIFCTVGSGTSITSPDGITWSSLGTAPAGCTEVAWDGTMFYATSNTTNTAGTSADGLTWTAHNLPSNGVWYSDIDSGASTTFYVDYADTTSLALVANGALTASSSAIINAGSAVNPTLNTIYPAYLLPANLLPPYMSAEIVETEAIEAFPYLDMNGDHTQLMRDKVKITMYGLGNNDALYFQDFINQYSLDYDSIGIMNTPRVYDEKRTQSELGIIAAKKTIEFEVSYYQHRSNSVARQLILNCLPNYIFN